MSAGLLDVESMADETLIGFDAREAGKYDARWRTGVATAFCRGATSCGLR